MDVRCLKYLTYCSIAFAVTTTSAFADIASSENPKPEKPAVSAQANAVSGKRKVRAGSRQAMVAYSQPASSSSLVSEARRYLGTNPTNRRSLWCGAFMNMVLERTGHRGGGNLAKGYANYGTRVSGPQVGALAVMSRGRGGGHVGVVSGVDENGNVIVVSGNHNNTVAESVYPRSRILAYVMPNG